jgi:hypothetical protein
MNITSEMLVAAVQQAVKEGFITNKAVPTEVYEKTYEGMQRVLEAALQQVS